MFADNITNFENKDFDKFIEIKIYIQGIYFFEKEEDKNFTLNIKYSDFELFKDSYMNSLKDKIEEKVKKYIGREMFFNEIASHYHNLRTHKYIVKKKIKNAICMDDDTYPSELFKKWLDANIILEGNKILGFFCAPQGFIKKSEKN
jgi:hypothetical protein